LPYIFFNAEKWTAITKQACKEQYVVKRILILDDDRAVCASLKVLLTRAGYAVQAVHTPAGLHDALRLHNPQMVILDMNFTIDTSGRQGLKVLEQLAAQYPAVHVILMTGWATVQLAVEGMKKGARDFIAKPWDNAALLASVGTIFELYEPMAVRAAEDATADGAAIIGQSEAIQQVKEQAMRIAHTHAPVLITGESGTGKELLAEMIHHHSTRSNQAFVKVNLGGIAQSLFESEMFGHTKGAFTGAYTDRTGRFELAHQGTIFLDEIGELDAGSQVKLLRVLQEKTFEKLGSSRQQKADVRVISATNRVLPQMIAAGTFREDLYYRINLIHLHLPALKERTEDIPLLAAHFVQRVSANYGLPAAALSNNAISWLQQQPFPGNIRQLSNVVERTLLMHAGTPALERHHFEKMMKATTTSDAEVVLPEVGKVSLEDMERQMILKTLDHHQYSISKSARSLGITRSALYRRLEKFNIPYEGHS
jgi:DNA-binding NtrC family response regulator